jgi:hypothetical protein
MILSWRNEEPECGRLAREFRILQHADEPSALFSQKSQYTIYARARISRLNYYTFRSFLARRNCKQRLI